MVKVHGDERGMSIKKLDVIIRGLTVEEIKELMEKLREIEQRHPEETIAVLIEGFEEKPADEALKLILNVFPSKGVAR